MNVNLNESITVSTHTPVQALPFHPRACQVKTTSSSGDQKFHVFEPQSEQNFVKGSSSCYLIYVVFMVYAVDVMKMKDFVRKNNIKRRITLNY